MSVTRKINGTLPMIGLHELVNETLLYGLLEINFSVYELYMYNKLLQAICNPLQILDTLLLTLVTAIENSADPFKSEEKSLARRFIRSVARVFVVLSSQMAPANGKRKM